MATLSHFRKPRLDWIKSGADDMPNCTCDTRAESEEQGRQWWQNMTLMVLPQLLRSVESTATTGPLSLGLIESVVQEDGSLSPTGVLDDAFHGLASVKVLQALDGQLVHRVNFVVVGWASKGEEQQALLLQVGFMDPREALCDDGPIPRVAGLQCCMLPALAFANLISNLISNHHPLDAMFLVVVGSIRGRTKLLGDGIVHEVGLAIFSVDGTNEQVVGNVVQVPIELEPGACS